jgi:hypothetical protein
MANNEDGHEYVCRICNREMKKLRTTFNVGGGKSCVDSQKNLIER